jgi:transcriptional regulator with XRE-family HTH domain
LHVTRTIDEARGAVRELLATSGLSMRALSAAMGRDADYVAAFLDPRRPTRARPTPEDLAKAADAAGTSLVDLLDGVWGISRERIARELRGKRQLAGDDLPAGLTDAERAQVLDYARFLISERPGRVSRGTRPRR